MGIIPEGTQLTERPEQIPSWDSQPAEHQALFARQAENYADFLEHTDYEVGRVLDAYEELGELDNTIVIYIIGDNGSSGEGSLVGTPNELMSLNGQQPTMEEAMGFMDTWGMPGTSPHYSVGVGPRRRHPVPVDQADRLPLRRHPQLDDRFVARPHHATMARCGPSSTT